jgi:hypothetical protein
MVTGGVCEVLHNSDVRSWRYFGVKLFETGGNQWAFYAQTK